MVRPSPQKIKELLSNPSVMSVMMVNTNDHPVPRGGLLLVMRPDWKIHDMESLIITMSGFQWGYADDGDPALRQCIPWR